MAKVRMAARFAIICNFMVGPTRLLGWGGIGAEGTKSGVVGSLASAVLSVKLKSLMHNHANYLHGCQ